MTLEAQAMQQAAFLSSYSTAFLSGQTAPLEAERQAKLDQLTQLYATRSRLNLLREDVRAFRDQLQRGATSGGALAYSLLKAQLFAGSSELPLSLQIQAAPSDTPSVADLDALLASTDTRLTALEQTIAQQVASFRDGTAYDLPSTQSLSQTNQAVQRASGGLDNQQNLGSLLDTLLISTTNGLFADTRITELETSYQKLLAEFDQKKAQLFVLTQERDLAQTTYTALSTRVTELEAANAADDTVVRLVGDGVLASVSRHTTRNVGIAMLIALLLSTCLVLFRTFWPQLVQNAREPLVPRRPATSE
jgi:hypothetical protein